MTHKVFICLLSCRMYSRIAEITDSFPVWNHTAIVAYYSYHRYQAASTVRLQYKLGHSTVSPIQCLHLAHNDSCVQSLPVLVAVGV